MGVILGTDKNGVPLRQGDIVDYDGTLRGKLYNVRDKWALIDINYEYEGHPAWVRTYLTMISKAESTAKL